MKSQIEAVRRFNRFYTREIGVLREGLLDSPFSLTEVRIMYELSDRRNVTAAALGIDLGLDRGYLSRTLKSFERRGLIKRTQSQQDKRHRFLALTSKGRKVFDPLNKRAQNEVRQLLSTLSRSEREKLIEAMETIQHLIARARYIPLGEWL